MADPEADTDPAAASAGDVHGIEGRLLDLVTEQVRGQIATVERLLYVVIIGGVLNTLTVAVLTGASLAIDMGWISAGTGAAVAAVELAHDDQAEPAESSSATSSGTDVPAGALEDPDEDPEPEADP